MDYDLVVEQIINISSSFLIITNELKKAKEIAPVYNNNKIINASKGKTIIKFKDFLNNQISQESKEDCTLNLGGVEKKDGVVMNSIVSKGSITLRKDGRYSGRFYSFGVLQKPVYGRTTNECEKNMAKAKRAVVESFYNNNDKIIKEDKKTKIGKDMALNIWFKEYANKYLNVKESTKIQKTQNYNYNIKSSLIGNKSISKITVDDIQTLFNNLDTLNRKKTSLQLLKELFKKALDCGYIKMNVVELAGIKLKKHIDVDNINIDEILEKKKVLELKDIKKIFSFLKTKKWMPYYFICKIAMFTGLRKGEILGLKYADFDYENKTVSIIRQYSSITKSITSPKNMGSIRKITLSDNLIKTIEEAKEYYNNVEAFDYVIQGAINNQVSSYLSRAFKLCGVKGSLHYFRHTYASYLRQNNIDDKVAQKLLGHESIKTTQDIYQELFDDDLEKQFDKINNLDLDIN